MSSAIALVVAGTLLLAGPVHGAEINVMMSGGFSAAYRDLVPEFERTTGHKLVTARGASMGTADRESPCSRPASPSAPGSRMRPGR